MAGVVIVGAGHGGSQCAASLRDAGYEGAVTLIDVEGVTPYHKPPLSKAYLKDADANPQLLRAETFYTDQDIEVRHNTSVVSIDRDGKSVALADGSSLPYEYLVLATGAAPRMPDLEGIDLDGVFALRTLDDAQRLRSASAEAKNVVVIGGGFIGMEAACTFSGQGKNVTVVEMAPRILGRAVAPIISEHVHNRCKDMGVRIITSMAPEAIEGEGSVSGVRLADGEVIACDLVVVGIGVVPETGLAEAAGLACDNGVSVDGRMQTSDPSIFAIGDCCNYHHWQADRKVRLESVQNATDQARHVAKAITGDDTTYREVPWFWSDQGDMKLQMVGLSFEPDRFLVSGDSGENAFAVYHFKNGNLIAIDTINRPADHMLGRKFIEAGFTPSDEDILEGPAKLKQLFKDLRRA
ncbi:MAG: NAD(P)/FAD-dependent oxidoreductase [Rhizobiaceae bacterium]